jgi:hypothetical protein
MHVGYVGCPTTARGRCPSGRVFMPDGDSSVLGSGTFHEVLARVERAHAKLSLACVA